MLNHPENKYPAENFPQSVFRLPQIHNAHYPEKSDSHSNDEIIIIMTVINHDTYIRNKNKTTPISLYTLCS